MLVNNSPHPYGGVNFQVVHHNATRNWRVIQFNQECWLMLLGFPLDYWNNDSIQNALGSFRCMIMWENDQDNPTHLSWIVQVEIVEQEMLGALSADEEPVPVLQENGQPMMFDFFGLGQQGMGPA
jgi:hypothetical protein